VVSFTSQSPTLSVARGDGTYIDFANGKHATENADDQAVLRGTEGVIEDGRYYPPIVKDEPKATGLNPDVLNWYSPVLGVADGYGSSAEQMMLAIEKLGKRVSVAPGFNLSSGQTHVKEIIERSFVRGKDRIVYCPPHEVAWKPAYPGQRAFGFSMWEDSILPQAWDHVYPNVSAILAPSTFCVNLFKERIEQLGLKTPIHYVPLGVNHELYPYRQRTFHKGNEPFIVLHCSTAVDEERKGGLIAYEAFCRAFPGKENVQLVFRCRQGKLPISDPRVVFDSGVATDDEKLAQMYKAHVLLYPSYGEGFGLIPLEAIASGLPAIVSANTGMNDYRDLFEPIQCDPERSGIAVYFQRESRGDWMKPRIEDAANTLRWMHENYSATQSRSAKTAKAVRSSWGYDRSARAILDILEG